MRRTHFTDMNCSVAQTLEIVGEWWTPLIIRDAIFGVARFDEFQERLGIARNVLTQRLETLVEHGVLIKEPYQDKPVRYEYRLTEKGRDLWLVIAALRQWGDRWVADEGVPIVLTHRACGHEMTVVPVCSACGKRVGIDSLTARPGPGALSEDPLPRMARR